MVIKAYKICKGKAQGMVLDDKVETRGFKLLCTFKQRDIV